LNDFFVLAIFSTKHYNQLR